MVGAVTGRSMPMPVEPFDMGQESLESSEQVAVGPGANLHDDDPGGRVRHEDRQQAVAGVGDEGGARLGQVGERGNATGPDRELGAPYGKMLRSASRNRPIPPLPGADS